MEGSPTFEIKRNNLCNLALLPKKQNLQKRDKRLNQIDTTTEKWLVEQIEKYEEIPKEKFHEFSDVRHIDELIKLRKEKFLTVFSKDRDKLIEN